MSLRCAYIRRLIRIGFVERRLSAGRIARLFGHLRHCRSCRSHYNMVMGMDRLVHSKEESSSLPSRLEFCLLTPLVLDRSLNAPADAQPRRSRGLRWGFGLGAAAVSACLFLAFWFFFHPETDTKGSFAVRQAGGQAFAVRAVCELKDVDGRPLLRSMSRDPTPQEVSSCPVDGVVRFAALARHSGYLYVIARFPDGGLAWLDPAGAAETPPWMEESSELKPLAAKLDPGFAGGFLYVDVVFVLSADPGRGLQIEQSASLNAGFLSLRSLPGTSVVVRRVDFKGSLVPWRK